MSARLTPSSEVDASSRRRTSAATDSVLRLLRQNATVRCPALTSYVITRATSTLLDTRSPLSRSISGGFHSATSPSPRGAPSRLWASTGNPHRDDQRGGLADRGRREDERRRRPVRRGDSPESPSTCQRECRRSLATRGARRHDETEACKNVAQRAWYGSTAAWSISGLVSTTFALRRTQPRASGWWSRHRSRRRDPGPPRQ